MNNDKHILQGNTTGFKRGIDSFTRLALLAYSPMEYAAIYRGDYAPEDDEDMVIMVLEEARNAWKPLQQVQESVSEEDDTDVDIP